jgi:hypothetical protein
MGQVAGHLETIGAEQYLLAFVVLGSYAFALGGFVGARGRCIALATTLLAAAGFSALNNPWEIGALLVAFALVGMGLFAGVAWTLWAVATWRERQPAEVEPASVEPAPARAAARPLWSRLRASLRFI